VSPLVRASDRTAHLTSLQNAIKPSGVSACPYQ
jgi:hypothetical protein